MVTGKIIQTYQGMKVLYRVMLEDHAYADAEVPYNIAFGSILCNITEGGRYRLDYDFRNPLLSWSKELRRREYLGYGILDEDGRVEGYICQTREGGFFGGYAYHIVSFGIYHGNRGRIPTKSRNVLWLLFFSMGWWLFCL